MKKLGGYQKILAGKKYPATRIQKRIYDCWPTTKMTKRNSRS